MPATSILCSGRSSPSVSRLTYNQTDILNQREVHPSRARPPGSISVPVFLRAYLQSSPELSDLCSSRLLKFRLVVHRGRYYMYPESSAALGGRWVLLHKGKETKRRSCLPPEKYFGAGVFLGLALFIRLHASVTLPWWPPKKIRDTRMAVEPCATLPALLRNSPCCCGLCILEEILRIYPDLQVNPCCVFTKNKKPHLATDRKGVVSDVYVTERLVSDATVTPTTLP